MTVGILLAGGKSSRIGKNKMDLIIGDKKVIEHTLQSMVDCVDFVTIVTGQYNTEINDSKVPVHFIHNDAHHLGMFSSILTGIKDIEDNIFIIPGDYPMVKPKTYEALLNGTGKVRVPVYNGRKGHPIYIDKSLLGDLKSEPLDSNLKLWRNKHKVNYIDVDDNGILLDIDTLNDYQNILNEKREESNEN